jgi:hypothetical protein
MWWWPACGDEPDVAVPGARRLGLSEAPGMAGYAVVGSAAWKGARIGLNGEAREGMGAVHGVAR